MVNGTTALSHICKLYLLTTPKYQNQKKPCKYFIYKVCKAIVAGAGLEPATFGL